MMATMRRMTAGSAMKRAVALWSRVEPVVTPWLGGVATALTLGIIVWELRDQDLRTLASYIPANAWFWMACLASILVAPLAEWCILRRLLGLGTEALFPLVRKQSLNSLIFGYAGDAYFMAWLQNRIGHARRAFALVCDLAVVSSLVNSAATVFMLALMWAPLNALAGKRIDAWAVVTMLALVLVPVLILAWSRVRSGSVAGLGTIILFQGIRTIAVTILIALSWHFALPAVPVAAWLLLSAARMVVSRIPIVPNKELAFLACVAIFAGPHDAVVPMIASVSFLSLGIQALLVMVTHATGGGQSVRETALTNA